MSNIILPGSTYIIANDSNTGEGRPVDARQSVQYYKDIVNIEAPYIGCQVIVRENDSTDNAHPKGIYVITALTELYDVDANGIKPLKEVVGATKEDIGLGNVDNTSDLNKPISTATQTALNNKANSTDLTSAVNTINTALNGKADKAITLAGYGITDAYTKTEVDNSLATKANTSDVNSALAAKANTADVNTALAGKQNVLTFDNTPTAGSTNPVTSGGVKAAIDAVEDALETKADAATTLAGYGITDGYTKTEGQALESAVDSRLDAQDAAVAQLDGHALVIVDTLPTDASPAETPDPDVIYRLYVDDGQGNVSYDDYMYNTDDLTTPIKIATYALPGIDDEPTAGSSNLVKSGGVAKKYGEYEESSEFVYVKTDVDSKILWAIKIDGSIYYGAGVPQQVKDYIQEKIDDLSLDEYEDIVAFLDGLESGENTLSQLLALKADAADVIAALELKANSTDVTEALEGKVDKVEGESLIDAEIANSKSAVENFEWLEVTIDNENKVLEGLKPEGKKEINVNTTINGNAEIAGDVDLNNAEISFINDNEFAHVELDKEGRILWGIKKDGTFYSKSLNDNLAILNDNLVMLNNEIEGIKKSGKKIICCWGSSSVQGYLGDYDKYQESIRQPHVGDTLMNFPRMLQMLLGDTYEVWNCGIGGEGVPTLLARLGAIPMYNNTAFTLPADGSFVKIAKWNENTYLKSVYDDSIVVPDDANSSYPEDYRYKSVLNPIFINGIECTLDLRGMNIERNSGSNVFQNGEFWIKRNTPSEADELIPAGTVFTPYGFRLFSKENNIIHIYLMGANGGWYSCDDFKNKLARCIRMLGEKFVVLGYHTNYLFNSYSQEQREQFHIDLPTADEFREFQKKEYGCNFLDLRYLMSKRWFMDFGREFGLTIKYKPADDTSVIPQEYHDLLEPMPQSWIDEGLLSDIEAYNEEMPPVTLMADGHAPRTGSHCNYDGYKVMGAYIYKKLLELGFAE